eukprot:5136290-Lingulodinium_polyedra.AAC.1
MSGNRLLEPTWLRMSFLSFDTASALRACVAANHYGMPLPRNALSIPIGPRLSAHGLPPSRRARSFTTAPPA